ncbi:MAG: ABC transporter substrate-binding protein [Chloroflexota bacterium]|nr:ABC transporter substrate-binding protein [Chloroflexota bacterium]
MKRPKILAALAVSMVGAVLAGACSGPGAGSPSPTAIASSPGSAPASATSPSATPRPATATVRLALDWTPNTNHIGFYVAQQDGGYADRAIDLRIVPYASTSPEILVSSGAAECGISTHEGATFAIAAGAKERAVMAILAHTATEIAVRDDGSITRPRDLDGRLYAGFGLPQEVPELQAVIKADGGAGTFTVATLDTAAYEALYNGKADFTITFSAWEGIDARERGVKLKTFAFTDYGVPDSYAVVLVCNDAWLAANGDVARRFLAATVAGFETAALDPDGASARLVAANPGVFDANPALPLESARYLAERRLFGAPGALGRQTAERWTAFSGFLFDTGLLAGADGKPLASRPDFGTYFTNDYLP